MVVDPDPSMTKTDLSSKDCLALADGDIPMRNGRLFEQDASDDDSPHDNKGTDPKICLPLFFISLISIQNSDYLLPGFIFTLFLKGTQIFAPHSCAVWFPWYRKGLRPYLKITPSAPWD